MKEHPYWCPRCGRPLSAWKWSVLNVLHYIGISCVLAAREET